MPIGETVEAMEELKASGKIRAWGVSNFDVDNMNELVAAGGEDCATNQVLYNIARRGPEYDLAPWLARRKIPLMAYSPVEQGRLPNTAALRRVADAHDASPYQVALAGSFVTAPSPFPKRRHLPTPARTVRPPTSV